MVILSYSILHVQVKSCIKQLTSLSQRGARHHLHEHVASRENDGGEDEEKLQEKNI